MLEFTANIDTDEPLLVGRTYAKDPSRHESSHGIDESDRSTYRISAVYWYYLYYVDRN